LVAALALILMTHSDAASAERPIWEEPQDTEAALLTSDTYAWRLFVALNWPADLAQRSADSTKKLGDLGPVVWESWKYSSGKLDEVFLDGGRDPGPWLPGRTFQPVKIQDLESLPLQQLGRVPKGKRFHPLFEPSTATTGNNENHMNRAAFELIRSRNLYNVEGQEQLFRDAAAIWARARSEDRPIDVREYALNFPFAAKEVKAQWRPINESDKARYHWQDFIDKTGKKIAYGLTALHITTKDLPNWFWATFEHVDNPKRPKSEPWIVPSRDMAAGPDGYPTGMGIEGTRWENYRLRGTQIDFVDATGAPTILANSQIEEGFQTTSSCISCHARAAIGAPSNLPAGDRISIFERKYPSGVVVGSIGAPGSGLFTRTTFDDDVTGRLDYLPLDFVWSLMRAKRRAP
jgi:hypothetical protein